MKKLKKNDIFTAEWWRATAVRCVRTFAEAALGSIGGSALLSDVDWAVCLSTASLATVVAFLFAVVSLPEAGNDEK